MKKFWIFISLVLLVVACSGNRKDKSSGEEAIPVEQDNEMVTYKFKVGGLQDSVISDSIWRIIFQVEGIDKLVLSRDDSVAVFTVDPELVSNQLIRDEITRRGGVLLN